MVGKSSQTAAAIAIALTPRRRRLRTAPHACSRQFGSVAPGPTGPATLSARLFDRSGTRQLVLITCGGRYDRTAHRHDDNIVVITLPAN